MEQLVLTLGYTALQDLMVMPFLQTEDENSFSRKVRQHRIIMSDKLVQYYMEIEKEHPEFLFEQFYDSEACYGRFLELEADPAVKTTEEEFVRLALNNDYRVLIAEDGELSIKRQGKVKKLKYTDVRTAITDKLHPLNMYSFPITNYHVKAGESCFVYLKWFERIFRGEKNFRIIDAYFAKADNVEMFNRYYLPIIPINSSIEIYCDDIEDDVLAFDSMIKNLNRADHKFIIYKCPRKEIHDRFIWSGNVEIHIGLGTDFINGDDDSIRSNTTISITTNTFEIPEKAELIDG